MRLNVFTHKANIITRIIMTKDEGPRSKDGNERPARGKRGKFAPIVSARVAALKMLARRELSEAQVRQRLTRRGYDASDIEAAVERLKADRSIDDARVAGAIARTEVSIRRRGKRRVVQQIQQAGISRAAARQAADETFEEMNEETLLASALNRRLKSDRTIVDEREFQRLYRYLIRQGFDADDVFKALSARRAR
jgi:regulatory protein